MTEAALMQMIKNINDEHKAKWAAEKLAAGGGPPPAMGKGGSGDPWSTGRLEGAGGAELIDPESCNFTETSRWLYTYFAVS